MSSKAKIQVIYYYLVLAPICAWLQTISITCPDKNFKYLLDRVGIYIIEQGTIWNKKYQIFYPLLLFALIREVCLADLSSMRIGRSVRFIYMYLYPLKYDSWSLATILERETKIFCAFKLVELSQQ